MNKLYHRIFYLQRFTKVFFLGFFALEWILVGSPSFCEDFDENSLKLKIDQPEIFVEKWATPCGEKVTTWAKLTPCLDASYGNRKFVLEVQEQEHYRWYLSLGGPRYEIDWSHHSIQGGFKRFIRGTDLATSEQVAFLFTELREDNPRKYFVRELLAYQYLAGTRGTMQLKEFGVIGPAPLGILVLKLYEGDLAVKRGEVPLKKLLHDLLPQTMRALYGIHARDVIYRDFKPENLLLRNIGSEPELAVADFGLAMHVTHRNFGKHIGGTPGFIAIDLCTRKVFDHEAHLSRDDLEGNDFFGLGMVYITAILGFNYPYYTALKDMESQISGKRYSQYPDPLKWAESMKSLKKAYNKLLRTEFTGDTEDLMVWKFLLSLVAPDPRERLSKDKVLEWYDKWYERS